MPNPVSFKYTSELVNSIPEAVVNRARIYRGLRQEFNILLEPGNHDKAVHITIDEITDANLARKASNSIRNSAYSWGDAVEIRKLGFSVRTYTDLSTLPGSVYVKLLRNLVNEDGKPV